MDGILVHICHLILKGVFIMNMYDTERSFC